MCLSAFFLISHFSHGDVVINEFVSSNAHGIRDKDGDHPDWIELYNRSDEPISLSGYHITDDLQDMGWAFPDVTIDGKGFLLIFASGKDIKEGELHTNFRISSDGEPLTLIGPGGLVADRVDPVKLPTDVSYGRMPDGTDNWKYFQEPGPGISNNAHTGYEGILGQPEFSHEAGFYSQSIELTMHAKESDAQIIYTFDGSTPIDSAIIYSEPVTIEQKTETGKLAGINSSQYGSVPANPIFHAQVVKARKIKSGYMPGPVKTATYFIAPEESKRYTFPVLSLSADPDSLFHKDFGIYATGSNPELHNYLQRGKQWERVASLEFFDNATDQYYKQMAGLRIHGNFTRELPKKSFRLYARREYGQNPMEYAFFPGQRPVEFKRLIVRQSGNDWGGISARHHTPDNQKGVYFRDALVQDLLIDMPFDIQQSRPAILFLNGEYWGIYNIRERFDRFYIATNYLIDRDKVDIVDHNMEAEEGDSTHFIETITYMETHDLSDDKYYEEVHKRIDLHNFKSYYLSQIFFTNTDWPHNNQRIWRKSTPGFEPFAPYGHDGRWRWLMFDMDMSLALNEPYEYNMYDHILQPEEGRESYSQPFISLLENHTFRHNFLRLACDHLNTTFRHNRMLLKLAEYERKYAPEVEENINRWGVPSSINQWESNIDDIREYLFNRPKVMREQSGRFFEGGESYPLVLNTEPGGMGYIKLNSITLKEDDFPWTGEYFETLTLELTAIPYEGVRFSGWKGDTVSSSRTIKLSLEQLTSLTAIFEEDPAYEPPKSLPQAHVLSEGDYVFQSWTPKHPAGTYPDNMVFHQMHIPDPPLGEAPASDYMQPYNLTSRSRITGLGDDGVAFINTSNTQPDPRAGYAGSAMIALDTRDVGSLWLTWEAGTILPNNRDYAIRVQYRIGKFGPFHDLYDQNGNPAEYLRNFRAGHRQNQELQLPENTENQPYVNVRFIYYYRDGNRYYDAPTGARAKLALHRVKVQGESPEAEEKDRTFTAYPNPNKGAFYLRISHDSREDAEILVFDLTGRLVYTTPVAFHPYIHEYPLNFSHLPPGTYILRISGSSSPRHTKVSIR